MFNLYGIISVYFFLLLFKNIIFKCNCFVSSQNLDCVCFFPIDLAPNKVLFDVWIGRRTVVATEFWLDSTRFQCSVYCELISAFYLSSKKCVLIDGWRLCGRVVNFGVFLDPQYAAVERKKILSISHLCNWYSINFYKWLLK